MDFSQWVQLTMICLMGAISPGPSLALVLRNTISGGREQGIMTGIGHGIGITFYALLAVAGLVTAFKAIPYFFYIAQIGGAFFLIWIGSKMCYSALSQRLIYNLNEYTKLNQSHGFIEGFLIAFLNPKIAAWLLVLFSQFVSVNATIQEQIVLVSTVGGIDAFWYCLVALVASSGRVEETLKRNAKRINLGMGSLLIIIASAMLLQTFNFSIIDILMNLIATVL